MGSEEGARKVSKSEEPAHTVSLAHNFGVGKFEITVGEYLVFLNDSLKNGRFNERWVASAPKDAASPVALDAAGAGFAAKAEHHKHPMGFVSWYGAEAYAGWLSAQTGATYRLLSEAEWEYAARAGSRSAYHFGDNARQLCSYANIADLSGQKEKRWSPVTNCDDGFAGVAPVGSFQPNALGLYDMLGNVAEWVADCWNPTYGGAPADGSAWTTSGDCNLRIVRGGSYFNLWSAARSAKRYANPIYTRYGTIGFRVARTLRQ